MPRDWKPRLGEEASFGGESRRRRVLECVAESLGRQCGGDFDVRFSPDMSIGCSEAAAGLIVATPADMDEVVAVVDCASDVPYRRQLADELRRISFVFHAAANAVDAGPPGPTPPSNAGGRRTRRARWQFRPGRKACA